MNEPHPITQMLDQIEREIQEATGIKVVIEAHSSNAACGHKFALKVDITGQWLFSDTQDQLIAKVRLYSDEIERRLDAAIIETREKLAELESRR